jgi:hypothetical protein
MKSRHLLILTLSIFAMLLLAMIADGQVNGTQNQPAKQDSQSELAQYKQQLDELAKSLSKTFNIPILVDPGITPLQKVVCTINPNDITATMNSLQSNIPDTAWKRVYCSLNDKGQLPSAERIASVLRALDSMGDMKLVVDNGSDKGLASVSQSPKPSNDLNSMLSSEGLPKTPMIVLYYSPKDTISTMAGEPLLQKITNLQRQQFQYMLQMDPAQISQTVKQSMSMFMQLDPNTRMQMLSGFVRGGFEMMQSLTPSQRQEFFQNMAQIFRQIRSQQGGAPLR